MKSPYLVLLFILVSCGGGGGGGGSSAGSSTTYNNPDWISSASTDDITSYKTTEYNAQWGLDMINAAEAYALLETPIPDKLSIFNSFKAYNFFAEEFLIIV